jgi:Fe-coproporphyrin III synthase
MNNMINSIYNIPGVKGLDTIIKYPKLTREVISKGIRRRLFGESSITNSLIKKPRIDLLFLFANSICNAGCVMCDVAKDPNASFAKNLQGALRDMKQPLLKKILNDPLIKGRKVPIVFGMTEPLLNKELPQLLKMCKQEDRKLRIITNAYFLEKRAEEVAQYLDSIQISIDGPKEIHDEIRGKRFYQRAIEGMKKIAAVNENINIDVNVTVFNINQHVLVDLAEQLDLIGVKINLKIQLMDFVSNQMAEKHNLQFPKIPQTGASLGGGNDLLDIDTNNLSKDLRRLRGMNFKNIKKLVLKPDLFEDNDLKKYYNPKGNPIRGADKCYAPFFEMTIDTSGKAFWHMRCYSDYILGDINEENLEQIFYGPKATYFRKTFSENNYFLPACSRCCGSMPSITIEK